MKIFIGMLKYLMLCGLLVSAASHPVRSDMFTESGIVDIPTGNVLSHGTFGGGIFMGYPRFGAVPRAYGYHYRFDAVAFRFNFGVFDRGEVGLRYLLNTSGEGPDTVRAASLKIQVLKERSSERFPSVAIGIENFSDTWFSVSETHSQYKELDDPVHYAADEDLLTFLAMSKTLRHQYCVHVGVATGERGVFVGVSKKFQPAFARGDITINFETRGELITAGIHYAMPSGLQIALGAANLTYPQHLRYLAAVSWTHE